MAFKRRLRFDKRIKHKKKMSILYILLFVIIAGLGTGYAYIHSDLNINGTANVTAASWDVHFENLQVTSGSVTATTPASITSTTTVSFAATLEEPNDFYEFTVDVENDGTMDAMIDSFSISPALTQAQANYLEYTITYSDGVALSNKQELLAGTTETLKVRFSYIENSDKTNYPTEDQTFTIEFSVDYTQADNTAIEVNHQESLYNVLKDAATEGTYAKEYTGNHQDTMAGGGTEKIYHWWADNDTNGTAILDKNNVIFAGFCWQMIRTTDTGGVKLVYNAEPENGECYPTESGDGQYNYAGIDQNIELSKFNDNSNSPAYVGYMYNPNTLLVRKANAAATSGSLFGNGVTYSGGTYTLTGTSTTYDATHHYTCNNTTGTCSTVRYYYYNNYYTEISDGRNIEQCLTDMLSADNVNQTNSVIKTIVDDWYASNMTSYTNKLEDIIFCNDRSISDIGGWNPNGGNTASAFLQFTNNSPNTDLSCPNITDRFSMENNKARLIYPVGLLTYPETYLFNNNKIRSIVVTYWTMSPAYFERSYADEQSIIPNGSHSPYSVDASIAYGVRPVVSLKPGTKYTGGTGSMADPYIVE